MECTHILSGKLLGDKIYKKKNAENQICKKKLYDGSRGKWGWGTFEMGYI